MAAFVLSLKIYFEIGAILLLAGLFYRLTRPLHVKLPSSLRVRFAQAFVVSSIVIPLGLHLLPSPSLPQVKFEIFGAEAGTGPMRQTKSSLNQPKLVLNAELESLTAAGSETNWLAERLQHFWSVVTSESVSLLVFGLLLGGWFFSFAKLYRERRKLEALLERSILVRKLGRTRVSVSDEIVVPFSTRISRTAHVVVPLNLALNPTDYRLAIYHELQHHRSLDTQWANAIEVLAALLFWNPGPRLWKREILELQELACDETLIGQRRVSMRQYGDCLIKVAEAALGRHHVQAGTVCMALTSKNQNSHTSFLRRRIDMFASYQGPQRKNALGLALGTMSLFVLTAAAYGAQQTFGSDRLFAVSTAPNSGDLEFRKDFQTTTERILSKYVKKFNAKAGFVVVSEVQTGRILAVANISDDPKATKTWALAYQLEPASAMKIPLIASALDEGATTVDESHDCGNGTLKLGNGVYHDWKAFDHLTTTETAVHSSNICSIRIAQKLGAEGVATSLSRFGFGPGGTASKFPQARVGQLPDLSKFDSDDYLAVAAMGVSGHPPIHVTALEMLQAYAAIGNDGKLMKPIMAASPDSAIEVLQQAVSKRSAREVKAILQRIVADGTGQPARSKLYTTAGKTSSASGPKNRDTDLNGGERSMAGFVGLAPASAPRLAVYVGVFDPHETKDPNAHGSRHAAPIFRDVIEALLPKLGVAPDQARAN